MAMSRAGAVAQSLNALAALKAKYESIPDDHRLGGFTFEQYQSDYVNALVGEAIDHIKAFAKAVGLDSGGDSHNLDIV
jgi:hypothetical protein